MGPVRLKTAPRSGVIITKELVFGRVLLRAVLRLDIVRALIRVSSEKRPCPRDGNNTKDAHSFPVSFTFPMHTLFLTPCLPTNLSIYLSDSSSCGMTYKDMRLNSFLNISRNYFIKTQYAIFFVSSLHLLFLSVSHHTINFKLL